jgi:hypothetical protein
MLAGTEVVDDMRTTVIDNAPTTLESQQKPREPALGRGCEEISAARKRPDVTVGLAATESTIRAAPKTHASHSEQPLPRAGSRSAPRSTTQRAAQLLGGEGTRATT